MVRIAKCLKQIPVIEEFDLVFKNNFKDFGSECDQIRLFVKELKKTKFLKNSIGFDFAHTFNDLGGEKDKLIVLIDEI